MNFFNILKGKDLLRHTFAYILAVIFFFASWSILGPGTAYIGATIAKGSLVLLGTDLTGNPLRTSLTFLLVFVFIGFGSFISALNLYTGLVINFLIIFILAYKFSSNIKQLIWRPFVLGYLYLLIEPGTLHTLPFRLLTLSIGAFFIVLTQFIVNKNKTKKTLYNGLNSLIKATSLNIENIIENKNIDTQKEIASSVDKIISSIYTKRIDPIFITKTDNSILNFTLYIERLNFILNEIKLNSNETINKEFFVDLDILMIDISNLFASDPSIKTLISRLDTFYIKYKDTVSSDYYYYEILQNIEMLKLSYSTVEKYKHTKREILFNRKLKRNINSAWRFNFSRDSLRFTFALRISTLLSISYFIVHLFNIPKGSWIVFTIYAVLDPLFENSQKRFSKRFKGTLLGIGLFLVIYLTIRNVYIEGLIFILMYYLYVINKDFGVRTMCTATVSLGLFAIISNTPYRGISYRFFFVFLGIFIGYFANKYFLPYNADNARKRITDLYYNLSFNILNFAVNNPVDNKFFNIFSEKIFLSKLYESKLLSFKTPIVLEFIHNQRILNNTIFFLFVNSKEDDKKLNIIKDFLSDTSTISKLHSSRYRLKNEFATLTDNVDKLLYTNLDRILVRLEVSIKLDLKLQNMDNIDETISS
ncbi:MAG: FUSC family protein [Sarcina sp.]